ncbi:YIP1 family protein [Chitinimonas sp. JJ19]|uniref:YIP1 family protein n=1 Tax=Chitinimonas sp. JJ19 TaxID=3109352 RepID=UPI003001687A
MQLINVFTEPGKLFERLKEKPDVLLPMGLFILVSCLVIFFYFSRVDTDWMIMQTLSANEDMKPADIAAAKEHMSGNIMMISGLIGAALGIPVVYLIMAVYYMLAGKVLGCKDERFLAWLSFSLWSSMPQLLSGLVALVGIFGMSPETTLQSLNLTHLSPLLLDLPSSSRWYALATSVDLLSIWSMGLAAIGLRSWTGSSWTSAIIVAALPSVVIYGIWAVVVAVM